MMSVFDVVRGNVTARQVAEHYGINVNQHGMCCCPFHNDKHPSMRIDERNYCFGCGKKGDAVDFVSGYFGLGLKDAALKICDDFHLIYDEKYHSKPQKIKPQKTFEQIYEETEKCFYLILCDYIHLLQRWKTEYAPMDENSEWHPYFCEALKETDHVRYLLDTLLYGDVSDRAFLITNYGRRIGDIERRIKELG